MQTISEREYQSRRERLGKKLKQNSLALVCAAKPKIRSNDTEYPYRQNSNFYYLCGIEEPSSALLFIKKGKKCRVVLFVKEKDATFELWNGKVTGVKKARKRYKVDEVCAISKLQSRIEKEMREINRLYYEFADTSDETAILRKMGSNVYAHANLSKMIFKMRLYKTPAEIELIRQGMQITKKAHHHAMRMCKSGKKEYELQAEFEYIFTKNGAYSDAYTTIVAGGDNANTLHYIKNDKELHAEDLVLIDAGCEYNYYATDITRTIPVGGSFSSAQKEIYALVLHVEKEIIAMVKPGALRSKLQEHAERMLCEGMVRLGILRGSVDKLLKKRKHKKYFPHGIGHYMGLDVHDPCPYKTKKGKEIPLQAGMVLTIEPGLYLPKNDHSIPKKYRGIGIRIEDDILVTKEGYENLSKEILKELEDIESLYEGCSS